MPAPYNLYVIKNSFVCSFRSIFKLMPIIFFKMNGGASGKEFACQRRSGWFHPRARKIPLEREMTSHASILAWEIPWTEEPGGLEAKQSQRVRHHWACVGTCTRTHTDTHTHTHPYTNIIFNVIIVLPPWYQGVSQKSLFVLLYSFIFIIIWVKIKQV